jgi:hypothetical protein
LQSMAKEIQALGGEDDAVVMKLIGRTLSSEGPHCPFSLCEPDDQEVLTLENTHKNRPNIRVSQSSQVIVNCAFDFI